MNRFFRDKSKNQREPEQSMLDALREGKKKTAEEVRNEITDALIEVDAQKEIYRANALRAIAKAKRAIASNNAGEKAIAYKELKFAYGIYHYMDTLQTAFRTIESQIQMQELTQEFAQVVTNLKSIRMPASNINFNKITATALKGMDSVNFAGLDDMVNQLIQGSFKATDASHANNQFLDDLVSGKATLDAPYPVEPEQTEQQEEEAGGEAPAEENNKPAGTEELLALLDQINAGLGAK